MSTHMCWAIITVLITIDVEYVLITCNVIILLLLLFPLQFSGHSFAFFFHYKKLDQIFKIKRNNWLVYLLKFY